MNNTLFELKNISYQYKNNLILNKVNLKINSGDKIALLGKSGSGKTTLISVLNGTIKPTQGEVKLFNKNFDELDINQKSHKRILDMFNAKRFINAEAKQYKNIEEIGRKLKKIR